ncbi:MAG: O-antigen ligase family protein [Solirubrobacterales bacterium]
MSAAMESIGSSVIGSRTGQVACVSALVFLCCAAGAGVATELVSPPLIALTAVAIAAVYLVSLPRNRHLLRVEAPFALLILSIVQWRTRTLAASTSSPIDSTVLIGAALQACALALAAWSLTLSDRGRWSGTTVPLLAMAGFAAVGLIAAPLAEKSNLAAYQAFEVGISLFVLYSALKAAPDAVPRLARLLFVATVVLVVVVWLGALADPGQGFQPIKDFQGGVASPINVRLHGVFPATNSDTVGIYGSFLCLWSLSLGVHSSSIRRRRYFALSAFGLLTVLISQYRTGYLIVAVGVLLLFALTAARRPVPALIFTGAALGVGVAVLLIAGPDVGHVQEGLLSRGQNQSQTSSANGRLQIWEGDVRVWEESPIVGHGLASATRYEVIAPSGGELNQAHSTWFEALAGTGTLGTAFLLVAVLATGFDLLRRRLVIPAVLWIALVALSITSVSMDSMTYGFLVYILLIGCCGDVSLENSSAAELLGASAAGRPPPTRFAGQSNWGQPGHAAS